MSLVNSLIHTGKYNEYRNTIIFLLMRNSNYAWKLQTISNDGSVQTSVISFCVSVRLATLYLLASAIRNVRCCHVYENMQIEVATTGAKHDNPHNR